ncbi:Dot/Icm T4SS effector alpha/beta hydrolase [Legionella sp. km772]|uniref:Dot/Icm T4SS effector alpha/beta hydrolase n=1 Tax=Legionella sp. km772 TaxID=2498111 RepID=UPI000F8E405B|nr:Dot/Icm T4SS effector alpha/beta hydrolase [Legionella sp. km772]RUR08779.1 protein SdbC [Legionella sp. km772]
MPNSSVQVWLQRQISSGTFPANREDWYIKNGFGLATMSLAERFACFEEAVRKSGSPYFAKLATIDFERFETEVILANKKTCRTEMIGFHPKPEASAGDDTLSPPGRGKHVLYFTGMGSLYQECISDIAKAVQVTGASYYAFEYPGMVKLGGEVLEVNDMVNTGMTLANTLLTKGISIDDILFQGDSFGAAIANKVRDQFKKQTAVNIRCILNNTFSTFQAAVEGSVGAPFSYAVSPLLRYTGWNIRTSDTYGQDTPYQIHINHVGDLTLGQATLARHVALTSTLEHAVDPCPEEFRSKRDAYSDMHWATLSDEGIAYLETKYGRNKKGQLDTHLADLYLLKFDNGLGVYETFICQYLKDSNAYVANHPQTLDLERLPRSLASETVSFTSLLTSLLPSRPSLSGFFGCSKATKEDTATAPQPPTLK